MTAAGPYDAWRSGAGAVGDGGEAGAGDGGGGGAGGVAAAGGESAPEDESAAVGSGESRDALPGLPPLPDGITIGTFLLVLVAALLALAALAFAVAALPSRALPAGRVRHAVRTSRSNLALMGLFALAATMLLLLIGAIA